MADSPLELVDSLVSDLDALTFGDEGKLDALKKRAMMILDKIFGKDCSYSNQISEHSFFPMQVMTTYHEEQDAWLTGATTFHNILNTAYEDVKLSSDVATTTKSDSAPADVQNADIFVVHGHDKELKQSVARTLEKLGLNPIILHEKPNKGRTIIEKFSDYSNVEFAVVLLSPDDIARAVNSENESYRARQNVVFELGFFLGKLGRDRVASIYRQHENFEMPSDYNGVLFLEFDAGGGWKYRLAKELKDAGYNIDFNAIA